MISKINSTNNRNRQSQTAFKAALLYTSIPKEFQESLGKKCTTQIIPQKKEYIDLLDIYGKLLKKQYKFTEIKSDTSTKNMTDLKLSQKNNSNKSLDIILLNDTKGIIQIHKNNGKKTFYDAVYLNNDGKFGFKTQLIPEGHPKDPEHITTLIEQIATEVKKLIPPSKRKDFLEKTKS